MNGARRSATPHSREATTRRRASRERRACEPTFRGQRRAEARLEREGQGVERRATCRQTPVPPESSFLTDAW